MTEKEKWYKTEHVRERFPEQCLAKWGNPDPEPRLYLPAINEFIPSQFGILSGAPAEVIFLLFLLLLLFVDFIFYILYFYFVIICILILLVFTNRNIAIL